MLSLIVVNFTSLCEMLADLYQLPVQAQLAQWLWLFYRRHKDVFDSDIHLPHRENTLYSSHKKTECWKYHKSNAIQHILSREN